MTLTKKQQYALIHKDCPTCKYWTEEEERLKKLLKEARWDKKHHRVR